MLRNASVFAVILASGLALASMVGATGCTGAAPAGFSNGDHWTFPLVGPLENSQLIAVASIHGKGPYLFLIDPDAGFSAIDQQVVDEAGLHQVPGPVRKDETGADQSRNYAELLDLKLGSLTIDKRLVMLVPSNFYNLEGRRVNGVLGRDVFADSLVFGFDRDQGIGMLSTSKVFQPPAGAIALKYKPVQVAPDSVIKPEGTGASSDSTNNDDASRIGVATRGAAPTLDLNPPPRRVVSAEIGGATLALHLDLGDATSQLREASWTKAKLAPAPADTKIRTVDELASVREAAKIGIADSVAVGAAKASHVTMIPYVDKRFRIADLDGSLGLDFFHAYTVFASWEATTFFLKPRGAPGATAQARLGRWGADVPTCPHPGCVTTSLSAVEGGIKLEVVRDPEAAKRPLEVYLGITPVAGRTAPNLVAELPAGADKISGGVPVDYEGATVTVLDVSAFTRPCSGDGGCVFGAPGQGDAPAKP